MGVHIELVHQGGLWLAKLSDLAELPGDVYQGCTRPPAEPSDLLEQGLVATIVSPWMRKLVLKLHRRMGHAHMEKMCKAIKDKV
jgi:hypothetical protein